MILFTSIVHVVIYVNLLWREDLGTGNGQEIQRSRLRTRITRVPCLYIPVHFLISITAPSRILSITHTSPIPGELSIFTFVLQRTLVCHEELVLHKSRQVHRAIHLRAPLHLRRFITLPPTPSGHTIIAYKKPYHYITWSLDGDTLGSTASKSRQEMAAGHRHRATP